LCCLIRFVVASWVFLAECQFFDNSFFDFLLSFFLLTLLSLACSMSSLLNASFALANSVQDMTANVTAFQPVRGLENPLAPTPSPQPAAPIFPGPAFRTDPMSTSHGHGVGWLMWLLLLVLSALVIRRVLAWAQEERRRGRLRWSVLPLKFNWNPWEKIVVRYHALRSSESEHEELTSISVVKDHVRKRATGKRDREGEDERDEESVELLPLSSSSPRHLPSVAVSSPPPSLLPAHLPDLINFRSPPILTPSLLEKLLGVLPAILGVHDFSQLFSSADHGCSLSTLYQRCSLGDYDGPTLLLVRDTENYVFGCYCNQPWRRGALYFGGGDCFLFRLWPSLRVYRATGANEYYMLARDKFLAMGGGDDFGLWLDESLCHGSSRKSVTFDNETLASAPEFTCLAVELWGFVEPTR